MNGNIKIERKSQSHQMRKKPSIKEHVEKAVDEELGEVNHLI